MLVPREELEKLIRVKPGEVFSRQRLTESTKAITDRLGNDGYAFANANAVPQIDKEKRTVAFTIVVDPGRRVYVRRINVGGNTKTRDEVVRREMRQLEGAYYDASKIQLSKTRIDRTQYFKDVNVETAPVADSADQVDVNFTVEEKPTGSLLLGAGFSTVDKLVLSGSISQANIFGSGKFVGVNVNTGKVNRNYLAFLPESVLHGRRREPGLRRLQAEGERVQPRGRRLHHGYDGRRRQVRLPAERNRRHQFRLVGEERETRPDTEQPDHAT